MELGDELIQLVKKKVVVRFKVDTARSKNKKIVALIDQLKAGGVEVQTVAPNGRNHNKFADYRRQARAHWLVQLDSEVGRQLGEFADPGLSRARQSL